MLSNLPLVRVLRKQFAAVFPDDDDVFDAATADARIIQAGFDRNDHVFAQLFRRERTAAEVRGFVDVEADAVAETVEESYGNSGVVVARFVAQILEEFDRRAIDVDTGDTGLDFFNRRVVCFFHVVHELFLLRRGFAFEVGTRHVSEIAGSGDAREDIANGVVESVVNKVVSLITQVPGEQYFLTGGLCEDPYLLERLSIVLGASVESCPMARFAGAIGAAIMAEE